MCALSVQAAAVWKTMFAYNNVTQIAMSDDCVYALSDGSLFSVDKQTEKISVYNSQSGLHGTGIACIYYDERTSQLIIGYKNGKIDLLRSNGTKYIGDLYDKDMTQRKDIYNITVHQHTAYLSTHYGVQTMDMRESKLVDSYWLRPNGEETPVADVLIQNDSIYAFSTDSLYCAALSDNLVDYRVWQRELRSGRISPDTEKGTHYQDSTSEWFAGGEEGIVRFTATERMTYKPDGPLVNYSYRIRHLHGKTIVVPGGYAVAFYKRPGVVMVEENEQWRNYNQDYIAQHLGISNAQDFCDAAIDPTDSTHFFVASFGFGLLEFRNNEFVQHYMPSNSPLEPCFPGGGTPYIWVDGLTYDADGNLWMTNVSTNGIKILMRDSTWVSLSNDACKTVTRGKQLIISNQNPNIKFIPCLNVGLGVMDDNGTIADQEDDRAIYLTSFVEENETVWIPRLIHYIYQPTDGSLLIGSDDGLHRIAEPEKLLNGEVNCSTVRVPMPELGIENVFEGMAIQCIEEDNEGNLWIGTNLTGVYCISSDLKEVKHHFSTDNSAMPSGDVQSLCFVANERILYVGTGLGLVACYLDNIPEGTNINSSEQEELISYGSMKQWKTHFSYNTITSIDESDKKLYCVANGTLVLLDKATEELLPQSKLTGLNGTTVVHTAYNRETQKALVLYENGLMDVLYSDDRIANMPDLFLRTQMQPGEFYSMYSHKSSIYICSSLGIIHVNMRRNEIAGTYILRKGNNDVQIHSVCVVGDSIYAASAASIYAASLNDNLLDYSVWHPQSLPYDGTVIAIGSHNETVFVHTDDRLYSYHAGQWTRRRPTEKWEAIYTHTNGVFGRTEKALYALSFSAEEELSIPYLPNDILQSGSNYWIALNEDGIIKWSTSGGTQKYSVNCPFENFSYRLRITGDKLIMLPGGYFGVSFGRLGNVMMLENGFWTNYTYHDIMNATGGDIYWDLCDAVMDPNDVSHFYVASFGYGLLEFRNNAFYHRYKPSNTANGLEAVIDPEDGFTWVDGLTMDSEGNVWMLNNSASGVKVLKKNGKWVRYNNRATNDLNRTKDLLIWNQNSNIKILTCARSTPGVGVFDDNGTIDYTGDDKSAFFTQFIDQNGKLVSPQFVYSICQMANGEVWVGTDRGIFILKDVRKLLNNDNSCRRIIIPRNDGTGLGDYLLADEQINAIVEDASGRKWIGTENSGLYLIEDDTITVAHFTPDNSPLMSNGIYALALHSKSGELFVGTSVGLLSYQSDANEPKEDMTQIYAYPNPVAKNYTGYISITGLMDNTVVNIIDEGGNLVCKTRSHGGLAIWDGRDAYGRRATPGVYTALCNAVGGHGVCKILILHETR